MQKLGQHIERKHASVETNEEVPALENGEVAPLNAKPEQEKLPAKNFQCPLCDSKFNREEKLSRHIKSHENIDRTQRICRVCNKYMPSLVKLQGNFQCGPFRSVTALL